ncbi:protein of unassigned function [Methylobacterium oryzae CBMB20]|uniref:Protein of unassigned function n=1 Tax=Methylobacterium oryzae CBMB20 TaxID=693986 RepID=A0A089Q954_9HYPH|nr:protein of unassigned function [Methylobacterium oryzae CBMB20]
MVPISRAGCGPARDAVAARRSSRPSAMDTHRRDRHPIGPCPAAVTIGILVSAAPRDGDARENGRRTGREGHEDQRGQTADRRENRRRRESTGDRRRNQHDHRSLARSTWPGSCAGPWQDDPAVRIKNSLPEELRDSLIFPTILPVARRSFRLKTSCSMASDGRPSLPDERPHRDVRSVNVRTRCARSRPSTTLQREGPDQAPISLGIDFADCGGRPGRQNPCRGGGGEGLWLRPQ